MPIFLQMQYRRRVCFILKAILMVQHCTEGFVVSRVDAEAIVMNWIRVVQLFCDLTRCPPYQFSSFLLRL